MMPRSIVIAATGATFALCLVFDSGVRHARAGDFAHTCASSDGQFVMDDDTLYTAETLRSGGANQIPYSILNETTLEQREGYCLGRIAGVSSTQRFGYAFRRYLRKVRTHQGANSLTLTLLCELASDGRPATQVICDRNVETLNIVAQISQSPRPNREAGQPNQFRSSQPRSHEANPKPTSKRKRRFTLWSYNGATVRLLASGNKRTFVYHRPPAALQRRGVHDGTVVFEGRRNGRRYSGTGYVFSTACGPQPFRVSGTVTNNQTGVRLMGDVVGRDRNCAETGLETHTMRFDLKR